MTEPVESSIGSWWRRRSTGQKVAIAVGGSLIGLIVLGELVGEEQPADQPTAAEPTTTQAVRSTPTSTSEPPSSTEATSTTAVSETAAETSSTVGTTSTTVSSPTYQVLEVEDVSFPGAVRISLRIAVDAGTNRDQLRVIAEEIVSEHQTTNPFQALNIFFYHYPELSHDVATLGYWEFAPYGEWGRADEAQLGDYSMHEPNDRTKEKDWSLLPDADAIEVYARYNEKFDELDTDPLSFPSDEDVYAAVAAELGITEDDVDRAMEAILNWIFNEQ